jgi:hypothetical protein
MQGLRQDLIAGTFTHRTKYLPALLESWKRHCQDVPFIVQIADKPILDNFMELREKFRSTGKRFWLFMDDDIEFVADDTLTVALATLVQTGAGMVGAYSTFKRGYVPDVPLPLQQITWMPGYFQLVDAWKVGDVTPDLDLPDHNTSIDTTYSVRILGSGNRIYMAPTFVYHSYKRGSWIDREAYEKTNEYLRHQYGDFYFNNVGGLANIIGPLPDAEETLVPAARIDWDMLWRNRNAVVQWQEQNHVDDGKLKLHLGCGHVALPGYVNIDFIETEATEIVADITNLGDSVKKRSVHAICCQHVLEHISGKRTADVLRYWFGLLVPGGTLELGVPDISLCCAGLLAKPEEFGYWEDRIYGGRDTAGQFHCAGFTMPTLSAALTAVGFEIEQLFQYDANGAAPSIFCLARKPKKSRKAVRP